MAKKQASKALAVVDASKWAIRKSEGSSDFAQIMQENMGGDIGERDFDRVGMPGAGAVQWEIPDDDGGVEHVGEITGVIVGYADRRVYWKDSYGESEDAGPPDCSSRDCKTGVGKPGGNCASCPLAQFGSAMRPDGTHGKGQACDQRKLVFVLREEHVVPIAVNLAPSSLGPMRRYMFRLASRGRPFNSVVTSLGLECKQNPRKHSVVVPKRVGNLDGDDRRWFAEYARSFAPLIQHVDVEQGPSVGDPRDDEHDDGIDLLD